MPSTRRIEVISRSNGVATRRSNSEGRKEWNEGEKKRTGPRESEKPAGSRDVCIPKVTSRVDSVRFAKTS